MPSERVPLVVLISDLGSRDPAIAQLKAAALAVHPKIEFLDATHEVRPHDLLEGAFTLGRVFRDFPTRTIFAVLVDQFRGAPRRPLLAVSMDYYYFAPDNGVLSFAYELDPPSTVYSVTAEHYISLPANPLAHHRDIYGSSIGWLAKGIESSNFGEPVTDYVRTKVPRAERAGNEIRGMALHVDRFGSLITNIPESEVNVVRRELGAQVPFRAVHGDASLPVVGGWQEGGPEVFAAFGATGHVELVSAKGEAAKLLGAKRGDAVSVVFGG